VLDIPDLVAHPHTRHRGMVVEQDGYKGTGNPVKLSRTPASVRRLPPAFGEATRAVLGKAGLSQGEIDALIAEGVAFEPLRNAAE
jgi:crotonobetainyl-CoA:carnitine CoA-transferase CaiB-like acyl-CoA transferase